jgi:L-aspartate oxidase
MPKLEDWSGSVGESDELVTVEDSPELKRLRAVMSEHVGVIRDRAGLKTAIREIVALERKNARVRFSNIATTAKMIAVGAYLREESRGGHYRSDFTATEAAWQHRTFLTLDKVSEIAAEIAEEVPA